MVARPGGHDRMGGLQGQGVPGPAGRGARVAQAPAQDRAGAGQRGRGWARRHGAAIVSQPATDQGRSWSQRFSVNRHITDADERAGVLATLVGLTEDPDPDFAIVTP